MRILPVLYAALVMSMAAEPLSIARQGYVFAGGKYSAGRNGQTMSGQLYAEFQIPSKRIHPLGGECGVLAAVNCQRNRCFSDSIPAIVDFANGLVDIANNRAVQVVGKECVHDCFGPQRVPIFSYSVYRFVDGIGFTDSSREADSYYRTNILLVIQKESEVESRYQITFAKDKGRILPEMIAPAKAASRYVYADYERRVEGRSNTGLEDAIRWVESDNSEIKELGLQALSRIGDPSAETKLQELLSKTNDQSSAARIESFLVLRRERIASGELK